MAYLDDVWYTDFGNGSSTGYWSISVWTVATAVTVGTIRRPVSPTSGSERAYICVVAGTTHATTQPGWVTSRGALTTDNTVTWQECTGQAALNGDNTNTPTWASLKASTSAANPGQIIKNNSGTSYQICTVAGNIAASEPSFSSTAGVTTVDSAATWTSLGVVGNWTSLWIVPHARLSNVFIISYFGAGDRIYVASSHAETSSSIITIDPKGTLAAPGYILCVNKSNVPPTSANLATGASITTTGTASILISCVAAGVSYFYGISFSSGSGANSVDITIGNNFSTFIVFKSCSFVLGGTSGGNISITANTLTTYNGIEWDNCTVQFASIISSVNAIGYFSWRNTLSAVQGATIPTSLMQSGSAAPAVMRFDAVDFSALVLKTLITNNMASPASISLNNCRYASSMNVADRSTGFGGPEIYGNCSDSAATNYRMEKYSCSGNQTTETTIIRSGGASDGTTPVSWKFVTTSNAPWYAPMEAIPITVWNDITGVDLTVTVYGIVTSATIPNNDEVWIDVSYLSNVSYPLASYVTTTKADILATGSALSSDSSTWGGSTTKFKMTATIHPEQKGYVTIYVKLAKPNTTYYIDPLVTIT